MKKNMGTTDRAVRGVVMVGAVVASGVIGFSTAGGIVLLAVAAIMALTAASGYCPLYRLVGVETTCETSSGTPQHGFHLHRAA
jgi:hypothetical protein